MIYRLLSRLPLRVLYAVARVLSWLVCRVFRYRRGTVLENLRAAFADYSEARIESLAGRFYRELGEVFAETVKLATMRPEELQRRMRLDNPEIFKEADAGRPVLLLSAHCGNWEWLLQSCVLSLGWPMFAVYKPQRGSAGAFIRRVRARFGGVPVPHREVGATIARQRRRRCLFAMIADQAPKRADGAYWVPFLGRPAAFVAEIARLAAMFKTPVFFVACERRGRGFYGARFERLGTVEQGREEEFIRRYAEAVERCIVRSPQSWLWTHRRWKHPPPENAPLPSGRGRG